MLPKLKIIFGVTVLSLVFGGLLVWRKSQSTEPTATLVNADANQFGAALSFNFPQGLQPTVIQQRTLSDIRAKYTGEYQQLQRARLEAQSRGVDQAQQEMFYANEKARLQAAVNQSIDTIITPEQHRAMQKK